MYFIHYGPSQSKERADEQQDKYPSHSFFFVLLCVDSTHLYSLTSQNIGQIGKMKKTKERRRKNKGKEKDEHWNKTDG